MSVSCRTAGSPIYQYIRHGLLDLSQHDRRRLSGQVEAQGKGWPSLRRAFLSELHRAQQQQQQGGALGQAAEEVDDGSGCDGAGPCCNEGSALGAVLAREASAYDPAVDPYCSLSDPPFRIDGSGVVGSPSPSTPGTAGAERDGAAGVGWNTPSPPSWQGNSGYRGGGSAGSGRLQGWAGWQMMLWWCL